VSRDNEAIAAVVSLAAKNDDVTPREVWESRLNELRDAFSRILHEREAWDTMALGREAIHFSHFCSGQDFHG
jgi:hypothetical protein